MGSGLGVKALQLVPPQISRSTSFVSSHPPPVRVQTESHLLQGQIGKINAKASMSELTLLGSYPKFNSVPTNMPRSMLCPVSLESTRRIFVSNCFKVLWTSRKRIEVSNSDRRLVPACLVVDPSRAVDKATYSLTGCPQPSWPVSSKVPRLSLILELTLGSI